MECVIRRVSDYNGKPCEEAIPKELTYIDRRTVKTLEEARLPKNRGWSDNFFASGTNHREENGMVARDLKVESVWVIDVPNLEYLLMLFRKYGELIIGDSTYKESPLEITIYDDYIE